MKSAKRGARKIKKGATIFLIVMLTIPVAHWLIFWLGVNIDSIALAFQYARGGWTLSNFRTLFLNFGRSDEVFLQALLNTLTFFAIKVFVIMPICFIVSYFLYKRIAGYKFYRVTLFLPQIISGVTLTTVFSSFIAPYGPLGEILGKMGVSPVPEFLANSDYALGTIIVYTLWVGIGSSMLLFSGAMSRVPLEVLESARLDGCHAFKEMIYIILPMVWPTLSTVIILQCTGIFAASGPILLFTKGKYGTYTLSYWIYEQVYVGGSYNNVAAAGLFLTAIGVPFILLIRKLLGLIPAVEY